MSLVIAIQDALLSDDADQSERLVDTFNAATTEQKTVIDDIFVCLCGYSLTTLIRDNA